MEELKLMVIVAQALMEKATEVTAVDQVPMEDELKLMAFVLPRCRWRRRPLR